MGKGKKKSSVDDTTFDNDQLGENKNSNGGGKTKNSKNSK
jgi:hypothetical protein